MHSSCHTLSLVACLRDWFQSMDGYHSSITAVVSPGIQQKDVLLEILREWGSRILRPLRLRRGADAALSRALDSSIQVHLVCILLHSAMPGQHWLKLFLPFRSVLLRRCVLLLVT